MFETNIWGDLLEKEQNDQIDRLNREVAALKEYLGVEIVKEPERLVVKKLKK